MNNLKTNLGINLGANLPNRLLPSETTGALLIDLRRAKQVPRKALSTSFVTFPPLCSRLHRTGFGCTSKDKKTALHREGEEGISRCLFDTVTMVTCRLTAPCLGLSVNLLGLSLQPANYKYKYKYVQWRHADFLPLAPACLSFCWSVVSRGTETTPAPPCHCLLICPLSLCTPTTPTARHQSLHSPMTMDARK